MVRNIPQSNIRTQPIPLSLSHAPSLIFHSYDIGNTILKYNEGFWVNPVTKEIQAKPASNWDTPAKHLVEPLYYVLACTLASLNSMFFLLQAFWSYISKTVTKTSFVSSLEFKVNIVLSCLAVALYPTVQYLFRNDYVYRETVPQVIFSILTFFTGVLGIRTHFRLVALIRNARLITNEATFHVVQKLEYFKDMVRAQTMAKPNDETQRYDYASCHAVPPAVPYQIKYLCRC